MQLVATAFSILMRVKVAWTNIDDLIAFSYFLRNCCHGEDHRKLIRDNLTKFSSLGSWSKVDIKWTCRWWDLNLKIHELIKIKRNNLKLRVITSDESNCSFPNGIMGKHLWLVAHSFGALHNEFICCESCKHHVMSCESSEERIEFERKQCLVYMVRYSVMQFGSAFDVMMWWWNSYCESFLRWFVDWHDSLFHSFITIQTSEQMQIFSTAVRIGCGRYEQGRLSLCFVAELLTGLFCLLRTQRLHALHLSFILPFVQTAL